MSSILERALAQYDSRPTKSIEVPEWGEPGKPAVIYYKAPTLAIMSKLAKESDGDNVKQMALLVVQCSLNEKGDRIFSNMNWKDLFAGADPMVVRRISDAIMEDFNLSLAAVAESEKN
jgi:hypothetical protein